MNYVTDLASLCTPVKEAKWFDLPSAETLSRAKEQAVQALSHHEKFHANSMVPNARTWHGRKLIGLQEATEQLRLLKILEQMNNAILGLSYCYLSDVISSQQHITQIM